ncbi:MAG: clostripain-related cysteine peptidase [Bacteroidales bacterium]|nr:clostripain-related cysteine peptidase [Bacteroidales bacterium]
MRYPFNIFRIILIATITLSVLSCEEREIPTPETEKSVLLYFAANNDISHYLLANIESLKKGYLPSNGNIIIYLDAPNAAPKLFRLAKNKATNTIEEVLIEQYAQDERATDPAVLTRTLLRLQERFPAKEYGLIMSSHATGWLPKGALSSSDLRSKSLFAPPMHISNDDLPITKTFGEYASDPGMDLTDLANAIPYRLSFILFDACFMGGIETAFALRNVTDYLIASPTEILAQGFPFDKIMQPIFSPKSDLKQVCNAFYNFYKDHPSENLQSATIALYHTESLDELANNLKTIYNTYRADLIHFSPNSIQHYANASLFYDLDEFIMQLTSPIEYASFKTAINKVVVHKQATNSFLSRVVSNAYVPIRHFGGISTYIPIDTQPLLRAAYRETEWNRAVRLIE